MIVNGSMLKLNDGRSLCPSGLFTKPPAIVWFGLIDPVSFSSARLSSFTCVYW